MIGIRSGPVSSSLMIVSTSTISLFARTARRQTGYALENAILLAVAPGPVACPLSGAPCCPATSQERFGTVLRHLDPGAAIGIGRSPEHASGLPARRGGWPGTPESW